MRVFIDTEFTNLRDRELISLALVAENGAEFYGECSDFDPSRCSEFVRETVLPQLGRPAGRAMPLAQLRTEAMAWLLRIPVRERPILCYDNDADLRILESRIGRLPKRWQQENIWTRLNSAGLETFFAEHGHQHHALWDARANLACFQSKSGSGLGQI
ncbi:3'-5' exoribonuclease [Burkholderia sp. Bp9004]|uniref:3'-5' exoribonuclease n=1 Tax=Burkholderia sp. Bp9004 TaxID=2184559 RepID=UPI0021AB5B57|nr:3'-5' exoribonuclease [Burkholderia sp. Bp9004]